MPTSSHFHALIRTHHITSRKKVTILRAAAREQGVSCLLRSGGVPGLMYVRGIDAASVQGWVDEVHGLRYKDYQLVVAPDSVEAADGGNDGKSTSKNGEDKGKKKESKESKEGKDSKNGHSEIVPGLEEVPEVKDFGRRMEELGLWEWWRTAMGFAKDD